MTRYKVTLDDGRKLTIEANTPEEAASFGEQWARSNPKKAKTKAPTEELKGVTPDFKRLEAGRRQLFGAPPAQATPTPRMPTRGEAAAGQFAQTMTLGQAPKIAAALTGGGREAEEFYREKLRMGRKEYPVTTLAADIAGFAMPGGAVAKGITKALPAPRTFTGKVGREGAVGLGQGAVYGATVEAEKRAADQGLAAGAPINRLAPALEMGGFGAVGGAGLQAAMPVVKAAARPVERAVTGAVAETGQALGLTPGAVQRQAERVAREAVRRDLERAGITTLEDFQKLAAEYSGKPVMTAELTQSMTNSLTALTRGKGTTGDKVAAILEDRVEGFPARLMQDLQESTGLNPEEILGDIAAMERSGRKRAAPLYKAAEAAPFQMTERLQELLENSPTIKEAAKKAENIVKDIMAAEGRTGPPNPLEFYDEVKRQLDTILRERKITGSEYRQIENLREALVKELDKIVPDQYAAARKVGGEAPKLNEAKTLGQKAFDKDITLVRDEFGKLDDLTKQAYRGAFVLRIADKINRGQITPRILRAPNLRAKLVVLFGEDAADRLVTKFGQEFEMLRKGSRFDPNVGSVTSQTILGRPDQELDEILAAGGEAIMAARNLATGDIGGLASNFFSMLRRQGYSEAQLNEIGNILASSPEEAARILFPNEMARLGATPGGAAATNVLANPTQPPSGGRNTFAMPPEVGGGFVGGALGATQGETPEERARNALLGAAGGAVGGRMARGMTPDKTRMGSNLGNVPKPVQKAQAAGYEGADIGEAKEWVAARAKGLDMSQPARMERAKAMGFDTETVLYHGTASDFDAFDIGKSGKNQSGRLARERAIFLTDSPDDASFYANYGHPNATKETQLGQVMPLYARMKNPKVVDFGDLDEPVEYNSVLMSNLIEEAKKEGHDGLVVRGLMETLEDAGGPRESFADQYVIFDPSNIRSVNAAFDPASKESANILAGVGAVGAGAAMTGAIRPPDQKNPPGQRPRG